MVFVPSTDSTVDYLLDKVLGSVIFTLCHDDALLVPGPQKLLKPTISRCRYGGRLGGCVWQEHYMRCAPHSLSVAVPTES